MVADTVGADRGPGATAPLGRNAPERNDIWGAAGNLKRLHVAAPPLVHVARDGPRPLSYAEERLWFLSQSQPDNPIHNVPLAWRITGSLDVAALEKSLNIIVQRHEILRTSFPTIGGRPVAVVAPAGNVRLGVEDQLTASEPASERNVMSRAKLEVCRPFDLRQGPLLRAVLFTWAPGTNLLVLSVHQIAIDGGSIVLLSRELTEHYRALTEGSAVSLQEPPIQYADFAHWQRGFLQGPVLENGASYWSRVMHAGYAPLRLPGQSKLASHTGPALKRSWMLPGPLTADLKKLAQREQATEFMVFVAALQAVLLASTRAEDIIVFASFAGRNRPELRDVIGLLANVLPLRTDLAGNPSFSQLLRQVRTVILGAFAHQDLPLARIVEFLKPSGAFRRESLFQVMVIHHNVDVRAHVLPGLTFDPVHDLDNGVAHFPLLFDAVDTAEGLKGTLKYRSDILTEAVVDRMLADVQLLLERAIASPEIGLSELRPAPVEAALVPAISVEQRSPSEPGPEFGPRDGLERQLLGIWEDVLQSKSIGVRDNFFDLGGDSFAAVQLFVEIEALLGTRLPLVTLLEAPTVEQLAALLRNQGWEPPTSPLVLLQGGDSRPPLFCVPGVGGAVLGLLDFARHLGPNLPVYGLQAQGLDGRREPLTRVEDMAAYYINEILLVRPNGPFLLAGASFGGLVAFEMARQLEREGRPVSLVALFDTFAPVAEPLWRTTPARWLAVQARRVRYHGMNLLRGPRRVDYVRRKARTLRRRLRSRVWQSMYGFYGAGSKPLPKVFRAVHEAGFLARKRYVAGPYGGGVTLFRAEVRSAVDPEPPDMGWSQFVRGGVEVLNAPGDHLTMMARPNVARLGAQLRAQIDKVSNGPGHDLEQAPSAASRPWRS